jgi:methylated-DNA-[protein]-cysteine S-methyltransferase
MHSTLLPSPLGPLYAEADEHGLTRLLTRHTEAAPPDADGRFAAVAEQLDAYFAGELTRFDLPLHAHGTPFERRVWDALVEIPYGETVSYGELARELGHPGAARAVGRANALNPIAIIVPCHRVIGANGKLTGYAGGLDVKRRLLDLERGAMSLTPVLEPGSPKARAGRVGSMDGAPQSR